VEAEEVLDLAHALAEAVELGLDVLAVATETLAGLVEGLELEQVRAFLYAD
jgi:hypothetical protein